jgi:tRNA (Thr-GGU) A37 N-methylase
VSVCRIDKIEPDAGLVWLNDIDAHESSPLIDIKPYIPVVDRVKNARVAPWFEGWPEWVHDEGIGIEG